MICAHYPALRPARCISALAATALALCLHLARRPMALPNCQFYCIWPVPYVPSAQASALNHVRGPAKRPLDPLPLLRRTFWLPALFRAWRDWRQEVNSDTSAGPRCQTSIWIVSVFDRGGATAAHEAGCPQSSSHFKYQGGPSADCSVSRGLGSGLNGSLSTRGIQDRAIATHC